MTSMSSNWDGNKLVRWLLKIKLEMLKTLSVEADVRGIEWIVQANFDKNGTVPWIDSCDQNNIGSFPIKWEEIFIAQYWSISSGFDSW